MDGQVSSDASLPSKHGLIGAATQCRVGVLTNFPQGGGCVGRVHITSQPSHFLVHFLCSFLPYCPLLIQAITDQYEQRRGP